MSIKEEEIKIEVEAEEEESKQEAAILLCSLAEEKVTAGPSSGNNEDEENQSIGKDLVITSRKDLLALMQLAGGGGLGSSSKWTSTSSKIAHSCNIYFEKLDKSDWHCYKCHQTYIYNETAAQYRMMIAHSVSKFSSTKVILCPDCKQDKQDIRPARVCPMCRWSYWTNEEFIQEGGILSFSGLPYFAVDTEDIKSLKH